MKPYIHIDTMHWNLSSSVGKLAQNSDAAYVSYIQWYYTLAAEHPDTPDERKRVYREVRVTGTCSGRDDDLLVKAILIHQRALNHPVIDGRISPAHGYAGDVRI